MESDKLLIIGCTMMITGLVGFLYIQLRDKLNEILQYLKDNEPKG